MLMLLGSQGIAVSSGSACTSRALKASHVLIAMGIPHEIAQGSLLYSLGLDNNEEDIDYDDRNDPIDYEVADLEAEGWEVLHTEKNFGVAQSILFRRK